MYDSQLWDFQVYQKQEQLLSGIAFFGPDGTIFFDETAKQHEREYTYESDVRTFYRHHDTKAEFSSLGDKYTEYLYQNLYYPATGDRSVEGPWIESDTFPPSSYSPNTLVTPPPGSTVITPDSITVISPHPGAYIPLNWEDVHDTSAESHYKLVWGMVTYSDVQPDISAYTSGGGGSGGGGSSGGGSGSGGGSSGGGSGSGGGSSGGGGGSGGGSSGSSGDDIDLRVQDPIAQQPAIVSGLAIGDYVIPQGSSYGTCNSSVNIRLLASEGAGPLLSIWRCKSAYSNETGLPLPATSYSFTVTGSGATFTSSTEQGVYEIEARTMFGTHSFYLATNAPELTALQLGVAGFDSSWQWFEINFPYGYGGGYGYLALEPGVYRFEAWQEDPSVADYRFVTKNHWQILSLGTPATSRMVNYSGQPDPDGELFEVTISGNGLYGVSVFATCPELPNADNAPVMFDINVGQE